MSKIRIENGVVVGTTGGKYELKNPVARYLLKGFDRAIAELAVHISPKTIFEVGCGEGHVTRLLLEHTSARIQATDLSGKVLNETRKALRSDRLTFDVANVQLLKPMSPAPEMIVCCEVLEHLKDPESGLRALRKARAGWYLLSVPREPIWRIMNMARGAYLKNLGNSPGHIKHWSQTGFLNFLRRGGFEPEFLQSPFPWTVVLCKRK